MVKSEKMQLLRRGRCPECGGQSFIKDNDLGEVVCESCGLVVQDVMIDEKPEWRAFTPEERQSRRRVGPSTSYYLYDKGLSTVMKFDKDSSGRSLSSETRYKMLRLRRWHIRSRLHSTFERNLSQAMNELERLCDKLKIPPNIKETAAVIYRKSLKEGLVRGRSIAALTAASLYAACRMTRTPRTLKEIARASPRTRKEISRCYRLILRETNPRMPIDDPSKYVSKIASGVGLNPKIEYKSIELLERARKQRITTGKDPKGLAAAAIYIASILEGTNITQREIAESAGVTEVTVRNRYKGLSKAMNIEI